MLSVCGVVSLSGPTPPEAKYIRTAILAQVDSSLCARAILVCCFLFCVSSKSYITLSHGAQGMAFSRRPRWLFPGHSRATSRGQSSGHVLRRSLVPFWCRASRIPAQGEPSREDVRHTPFGDPQVRVRILTVRRVTMQGWDFMLRSRPSTVPHAITCIPTRCMHISH